MFRHSISNGCLIPCRIVFGLVQEKAYRGDRKSNPFDFACQFPSQSDPTKLVDLTEMSLFLNGVSVDGLMDDGYQVELEYLKSFEYLGLRSQNSSNHITLQRYIIFCSLFAFTYTIPILVSGSREEATSVFGT